MSLLHQAVQLVSATYRATLCSRECCYDQTAHVDYEVDMGTEFTIILNSSQQEANFTVITVDDQILEDYKEEFGILIFLDSPSILAITDNDQNTYNVTILDNEGWFLATLPLIDELFT